MTIVRVCNRISAKRKRNKRRACGWGLCLCRSLLAVSEAGEAGLKSGGARWFAGPNFGLIHDKRNFFAPFDKGQKNRKRGRRTAVDAWPRSEAGGAAFRAGRQRQHQKGAETKHRDYETKKTKMTVAENLTFINYLIFQAPSFLD